MAMVCASFFSRWTLRVSEYHRELPGEFSGYRNRKWPLGLRVLWYVGIGGTYRGIGRCDMDNCRTTPTMSDVRSSLLLAIGHCSVSYSHWFDRLWFRQIFSDADAFS